MKKKQGFKTMSKDDHMKIIKKANARCNKICFAFDLNGKIVSEFPSITEAAKVYNVSPKTISAAIKNGWLCANMIWSFDKNNHCKYSNNNVRKVCAINIKTKDVKIYDSIAQASRVSRTSRSSISRCLNETIKQSNGQIWLYYDKFVNLSDSEIYELILEKQKNICEKEVICLETSIKYNSLSDAAKWCGLKSGSNISKCCDMKQKTAGKHPETGERLHWMYYEKYLKLENV